MPEIITRCSKHSIVNREPIPQSIDDEEIVGQMRVCPICNKSTTIDYPGESGILSQVERSYTSPWLEE